MKKIYLKPEIESIVIKSSWALCVGSVVDNEKPTQPGDTPEYPGGAPRRRLF